MPDRRTHRGPHPADAKLFNCGEIVDFSLLLSKGYAQKSSLKLVGDKFSLTQRQRLAVVRSSCSDEQLISRKQRQARIAEASDKTIAIDGYNLLITIEAAMSGAYIFVARDGCLRDLASIHGTYRKVTETIPALQLIGNLLQETGIDKALWLLDSPVSNSGRLKTLIGQLADKNNWDWQIKLVHNPDAELIKAGLVVASSDSMVLDNCKKWINLAGEIVEQKLPAANLINLSS